MKGLNNECKFFLVLGIVVVLAMVAAIVGSVAALAADGGHISNCPVLEADGNSTPYCPPTDIPPATSQPPSTPDTPVPPVETEVPPTNIPPIDLPPTNSDTATPIISTPVPESTPYPPGPTDKPDKRSPKPTALETLPVTGYADLGDFPWIIISMPVLLGIAWIAGLVRRRL